jgi:hypothetical protein
MASDGDRRQAALAEDVLRDDAMHENGRLRIGGQLESCGGTIETELGKIEAKNLMGFMKAFTSGGFSVVKILRHPYKLGALSREEKGDLLRHQVLLIDT